MHLSILIVVTAFAASALSSTFKATVRGHGRVSFTVCPPPRIFNSSDKEQQSVLSSWRSNEGTQRQLGAHPVPIKDFLNIIYTTNISIGTPPQQFALALDLTENNLLVPSVDCKYFCADPSNRYNSSLSSSYEANGSYSSVKWAGINYSGHLSKDSVHIANLSVQDQLFEEWTEATCFTVGCFKYGYDGVLGLAPPWNKDSRIPNTLSMILSQDLLDSPIFSLKLPRDENEEGELLFGARNPDLYTREPITIPLINSTDNWWSDLWTVPATHVSFNSDHPIQVSIPNDSSALLDSGTPWLILPSGMARNLTRAIGAEPGPWWFHSIPCERRQELPTLTFGLGGHNFTITAFEYTLEVEIPQQGRTCLTSFFDGEDFWGPGEWEKMVLGSPFLRGFYSVFDLEKREVGLANLNR